MAQVLADIRTKLRANAALIQLPIGLEEKLSGVVDLVKMCAYKFTGSQGEKVETMPIPANMVKDAEARRQTLIEALADIDEEIADMYVVNSLCYT